MKSLALVLVMGLSTHAYAYKLPYPAPACHPPAANAKITATFAPETSLQDLATWVMGFTCKNIVIDAEALRYGAKLAVMAPKPLTAKQALALFVDSVQAVGLVAQVKRDTIIVKLGPKTPPRSCAATTTSAPSDPLAANQTPSPIPDEVDTLVAAGIKRVDATHYEVKSDLRDKVLADPMLMAKGARVVPAVKDGKPDGFKLYAIRPSSFYAHIGLNNGDTLQSINGTVITDADKALELYKSLRDVKTITLGIVRQTKPMTLEIKIVK